MKRYILFIIITSLIATSCSSPGNDPILSGKFNGASDLPVSLYRIDVNLERSLIAETRTQKNGKFQIDFGDSFMTGIYNLQFGNKAERKNILFVLDEDQKGVKLDGDYEGFSIYDFDVNGSSITAQSIDAAREYTVGRKDPQTLLYMMDTTSNPMIGLMMTLMKFRTSEKAWSKVRNLQYKFEEIYPDSKYTKDFKNLVRAMDRKKGTKSEGQFAVEKGESAPEIALPSPDGKVYKLSDLKGKVVLLDFWASWCGPCRRTNPHVVDVYEKYKDKGFTVYSVSLDRQGQKERWVEAIEKDKLSWPYHVSDLKFWASAAAREYGVKAIPATFLIDKSGKIAAINPRNTLEEEIQKLL